MYLLNTYYHVLVLIYINILVLYNITKLLYYMNIDVISLIINRWLANFASAKFAH